MTAVTTARAAEVYVAAVAAALDRAGVPDAERQELLDDLTGHLAELEAEADDGDALAAQLGSPADYAADLLASAGIVVAVTDAGSPSDPWWRRARAAVEQTLDTDVGRAVRRFLPELRPGWWVLRGWAVVVLGTWMANGTDSRAHAVFPLPKPFADVFPSYVLLAAVVLASVWIGRSGRHPWLDRTATAVGIVCVVVAINVDVPNPSHADGLGSSGQAFLVTPDGRVVYNIWPFDAEGRPLEDVLLYDQDGMPIDLGAGEHDPYTYPGLFPKGIPDGELPPPFVEIPRLPGATTTTPSSTTTTVTAATTGPPPAG